MALNLTRKIKSFAFLAIMGTMFVRPADAQQRPAGAGNVVTDTPVPADTVQQQAPTGPTNEQLILLIRILQAADVLAVHQPGYEKMMEGAIDGALKTLDPHSAYISAEQFKKMQEQQSGSFVGVGIQMQNEAGGIRVVNVMNGMPANLAGVQSGDLVTHVDGTPLAGLETDDISKLIRGQIGTSVTFTIERDGETAPLQIDIIRDRIETNPVVAKEIGSDIGYIRLETFMDGAGDQKMADAIQAMGEKDAYILDLRYNGGGLIGQAVSISDMFLDNTNDIVSVRTPQGNQTYRATPGDILNGKPLIVLTNVFSASASEMTAGALQDNGRATILGTQTFGKGSGQSIYPLSTIIPGREDAIKITTLLYFTPSGQSIQGRGITPNIGYQPPAGQEEKIDQREADMPGVLANPNGSAPAPVQTSAVCSAVDENLSGNGLDPALVFPSGKPDFQLICAVEQLRGSSKLTKKAPPAPKP